MISRSLSRKVISPVSLPLTGRLEHNALRELLDSVYRDGVSGAFYIPQPVVLGEQSIFQDSEGQTPVVSDGDPVGLIMDQSGRGNHAYQETPSQKPIYRTDGIYHWLEFDGVDDFLDTGKEIVGGTGLFASSVERFTVAYSGRGTGTFISRASATDTQRTFQLATTSDGLDLDVYLRSAVTDKREGVLPTNSHVFSLIWDGTEASTLYDNASPKYFQNGLAPENIGQRVVLGARTNGTGFRLDGALYGLMIVDTDISNINECNVYLKSLSDA